MAANSSVRQNNPPPSSPESAESSSAANDEEFFDVWLIKGIRIFWNFDTRTTQKKYLVSWLGYPWWHDSWEPRENIGEGCNDLVAHIERAAALGPKPAVGAEWLAPEDWLTMEEKRRLQSATDRGSQAKIDEARRLEEEDRMQGNPMGIEHGKATRVAAKQNLIEYEKYKAERNRRKQRPPASAMKTQASVGNPATNKEYRRWFRRTRRSTRSQGYFHYSGDDQELAEMTSFAIPSGKAPVSRASTGGNKKRRRNAESSSGENQANPSVSLIGASEGSDDDVPLVRVAKRKPRAPVPRKKKDAHVEGPPPKKQRVDAKPNLATPPPDSETSDAEVPLSKQKKSHVIQSSSDEDEPLAIRARKNKTQTATTGAPAHITPLSILNPHTPTPQPNPKVTLNPNPVSTHSVTLPSTADPRAQAKSSATGPSVVAPAVSLSPAGDNNTTQNNPPLSSYLRPLDSGPIVKDGVGWFPVHQAVNRKQYVGTSSKQQGPSLGTRARMLGEAPAVGRNRQVGRPSNTTTATKAPKPVPVSSHPRIAASASQPSKSAENNEEDLFGDNELEGNEQPADHMDMDTGFTIDVSEPIVVESPVPPPPKPSGPAPAVASKAAQLEVEVTSFLTDVMHRVAPSQPDSPRSGPQKGPRRIGLYFGSSGCERLCEVYLANVSTPGLQSAHLTKWIFPSGENHAIYLDKLHSASHAPLILPAFEPLQWARLEPWDEIDTPPLCVVKDWLSETNQFAVRKLPNKPTLNICIFSPRCKPVFDIFPKANPNYREDQGLVLVLLKRRFRPPQDAPPRETPEPLLKLPRDILHQDPDISRGLMLLKLTQNTLETWKTAWQRFKKPRTFSLFTMETILFRKNLDPKNLLYGDQLPAHDHAAWRLKHQPETKALLKILESAQLKPWHLMERSHITFIHNNSWELLKKLPGLDDRLGLPNTQFFAFGPHHSLSPDKWGVREVFKRGAVVTFTARSIAENGETFKELVERTHKSPISVAYVTPLTVALVEQMVTDVQLYPNNLESLRFLLDAILDSRISLLTAPPYSWKHDDMNKWRDMQFTFGTDESQLRDPTQASVSSLDKGMATPPQYRTYDSILTACAKELEAIQQEQSVPWNDDIEVEFRQLGGPPPHGLITTTTTTKGTPKTALQLEADVNTFLYSDLRLIQRNHFYQTEYRHFVVVESKNSTVFEKDKVVDSVAHLTVDEAIRLVDPVTQRRTNTV